MPNASSLITSDLVASALTYEQYVSLATDLLAQGRTTSDAPSYNTPEILGYARLNLHRMSRVDKLTVIEPELKMAIERVPNTWVWLVLTESWCGDAAQSVPVLHQISRQLPNISLRLLLRDKHPELMNAYLTNGGKSIPKLVCLRVTGSTLQKLGTWGPRPVGLQTLFDKWRQAKLPFEEVTEQVQRWYNQDRTATIQRELLELVTSWSNVSV